VGSPSRNGGGSSYYIQTPETTQKEGTSSDTAEAALIAKLQAQIQGLTEQINALLAQRQGQTGTITSSGALTEPLGYGSTGIQVVLLQNILKRLGLFPSDTNATGSFGSTTLKAVQAFQVQNNIAIAGSLGYGRVGPSTRAALNQLVK
jgi:peptidoglycan hydrolase-like protein with peptidoglycan-binding domain